MCHNVTNKKLNVLKIKTNLFVISFTVLFDHINFNQQNPKIP